MPFADSHVHLSDYPDMDSETALSERLGIMLGAVSIDKRSSQISLEIARRHPRTVAAFVGVHPSEAKRTRGLDWLGGVLDEAAGCGEIGLDPKYSDCGPGSVQAQVYESQIAYAERAGRPVQVHTRDAENACLHSLSRFKVRMVLLHWFEKEELLPQVLEKGYYISFGPAILYSKKLQRMAASFDRTLVLTESDGPVPFAALGGAEGPSLVPSVVFKLAGIWKLGYEETSDLLLENHRRFIRPFGKG